SLSVISKTLIHSCMGGTKCIAVQALVQSRQPAHLARSMTMTHFWLPGATDREGSTSWNTFETLAFQATPTATTAPVPCARNCTKPRRVIAMAHSTKFRVGSRYDDQPHLHVVVALAAFDRALHYVTARLRGRHQGEVLRAFLERSEEHTSELQSLTNLV